MPEEYALKEHEKNITIKSLLILQLPFKLLYWNLWQYVLLFLSSSTFCLGCEIWAE